MNELRASLDVCVRERGGDELRLAYAAEDDTRRRLVGRRCATAALEQRVAVQAGELGARVFGRRGCPHRAQVECFDVVSGEPPTVIGRRQLAMLEIPVDFVQPDARARSLHRRLVLCSVQRRRLREGGVVRKAYMEAYEMTDDPSRWSDGRLDAAIAVWSATVSVLRVAGPLALHRQLGLVPTVALHQLASERDHLLAWLVLSTGLVSAPGVDRDAATVVAWSGCTGRKAVAVGARSVRRASLWAHLAEPDCDVRATRARVQRFCRALLELEDDPDAISRPGTTDAMTSWAPPRPDEARTRGVMHGSTP